ncbi:hypothetical protein UA08_05823 [Talaromyces atroroseus]|uniref:Selenoprotein O n=1 Tax=Talaromyces atroroseus TaxID=1441469 RepID=A0A225AUG6_TALAT|nr:hypothetical protein UA08_05823 [Talaromyces atroroseus]OKL59239.1 hypothetical protein UA08_05823 [Talaromyces atroroseus]
MCEAPSLIRTCDVVERQQTSSFPAFAFLYLVSGSDYICSHYMALTPLRMIQKNRIHQMASHLAASAGYGTLATIPKSSTFTSKLAPDPAFETPLASHSAPRETLGPRLVKGAMYTYVRPETAEEPELLGRAISLGELTNPSTNVRYELQLKGAGRTPYSRFADGKAVLRSSIREYVVSEALHALGIPTTRALSLTLLPHSKVLRERIEPGAIVARFAQSWLRIGSFDILHSRNERDMIRKLATFVAEDVFPGWESLPGVVVLPDDSKTEAAAAAADENIDEPKRGIPASSIQGQQGQEENRFTRLYREIVRRNAKTVAAWQAYGFMNGVLNTDNTSIFGLSMDYGPFAFMDNFDPSYTPNHDDHYLRYSYKNQPSVIWWNLVRLGEAFGELIGSGETIDDETFITKGVTQEFGELLIARAEKLITRTGEEYKAVFKNEYVRLMGRRLGLRTRQESDFQVLFSDLLDTMEELELDFNHFFRRLSAVPIAALETDAQRVEAAKLFFHNEGVSAAGNTEESAQKRIAKWLGSWRERIREDWEDKDDERRIEFMKSVNPKFLPRSWILDEVIDRVEHRGDREILGRIMTMVQDPFKDEWGLGREEEERLCGDVPRFKRAMMCSCSS